MDPERRPPGAVMGIDYGSKRVGLAVSDPLRVLAGGAGVAENDARLLDRILALAAERGVVRIVVGVPYAPDGGTGGKAEEVLAFVGRLRAAAGVPVDTWDESRTSADAHAALRASGLGRKRRQEKGRVDEMAARILLQEYIDHLGTVRTA